MKIATRLSNNRDVMDEIYNRVDSHESELRSAISIMLADDEDNYKSEWGGTMVHDSIHQITSRISTAIYSGISEITSCYLVAEKEDFSKLVIAKIEEALDPKVVVERLADRLSEEEFSVSILDGEGNHESSTFKLGELLTEENLKLLQDTVTKTYNITRAELIKSVKAMFDEGGLLNPDTVKDKHKNQRRPFRPSNRFGRPGLRVVRPIRSTF